MDFDYGIMRMLLLYPGTKLGVLSDGIFCVQPRCISCMVQHTYGNDLCNRVCIDLKRKAYSLCAYGLLLADTLYEYHHCLPDIHPMRNRYMISISG